ncbi:DNA modification methylase [Clostridiales bacterium COT073_COT-073]|nr:DNA modification methylase [Clostridiales bacterium COT073_COT-073]
MKENKSFLSEQIITYIGNKRLLIAAIEKEVLAVKKSLQKEKLVCADLFAGSGIVGRMLKRHSSVLYANDLEKYSYVINDCYLSNRQDFPAAEYRKYAKELARRLHHPIQDGLIYRHYAPQCSSNIQPGERVFYTPENARIIDTARAFIDEIPVGIQKYFLAPLLYEASVHVNTGGVFKGFYKDSETGLGRFGGRAENALSRIMGKIEIKAPVFSNFSAQISVSQADANTRIKELPELDLLYLDPPYNQHPYGSNYFMLNVIVDNDIQAPLSKISGIPADWNRSAYNQSKNAAVALTEMIGLAKARYIIISYNSEGFIDKEEMLHILKSVGRVKTVEIKYNTYRAARNLHKRGTYVKEYLFVLKKDEILQM